MKHKFEKIVKPAVPAVTETVEMEITFPFYSKTKEKYFKLPTENSYIVVDISCDGMAYINLGYVNTFMPSWGKDALAGEVISEEEFNEAHKKAMALIESVIYET